MKSQNRLHSFFLGSTLLLFINTTHAASVEWDGGGNNNSWGTADNWNPDGVPTFDKTLDITFINNTRLGNFLAADRTIRSLTFDSTSTAIATIRLTTTGDGTTGVTLTMGGVDEPTFMTNNAASGHKRIGNASGPVYGSIVLGNNLTVNNNVAGSNVEFFAPISGNFGITKNGPSSTVFHNSGNSFTGGLTINEGNVAMTSSGALGTVGDITFAGPTSRLSWGGTNTEDLSGRIVMNNGAVANINTNTNNVTFANAIGNSSTAGLTKVDVTAGTGTLTLEGANTFSGATILGNGVLSLANSLALQHSAYDATASLAGTTTAGLRTTVTTLTLGGLTGDKNFTSTGGVFITTAGGYDAVTSLTLNPGMGATHSYSGNIEDGAVGMTLTKTGAGTQILAGNNSYTGATNVDAGTLEIGSGGSTHATSAVTVSNAGSVLVVNGTVNGTLNASASTIVSGSGTVGGAATVSGALNPGNSPGVLSFGTTLILGSTSATTFEIASTGMVRGTDYDGINIGSSITYGGGLVFDFATTFGVGTYTFNLFDGFSGTSEDFDNVALSGAYGNVVFTPDNGIWSATTNFLEEETWSFSQSTGNLSLTVIPEPSAALFGGLGLLALLRRRR